MQPLSTFTSKGSKSIFNSKKILRKVTWVKLIFIRRINGISLMLNRTNQKIVTWNLLK
jgi:hypothetical protein